MAYISAEWWPEVVERPHLMVDENGNVRGIIVRTGLLGEELDGDPVGLEPVVAPDG